MGWGGLFLGFNCDFRVNLLFSGDGKAKVVVSKSGVRSKMESDATILTLQIELKSGKELARRALFINILALCLLES